MPLGSIARIAGRISESQSRGEDPISGKTSCIGGSWTSPAAPARGAVRFFGKGEVAIHSKANQRLTSASRISVSNTTSSLGLEGAGGLAGVDNLRVLIALTTRKRTKAMMRKLTAIVMKL